MKTQGNEVMFAGGVPGDSVEDVFRMLSDSVGDKALGYPDGEIDERAGWVVNLAHNTWPHVKGLEQLNPPVDKELDVEAGTSQFNHYTVREGVTELDLRGLLPYARAAIESYAIFTRLRNEGVIPAGVRFQTAIPCAYDAYISYFPNAADWPIATKAWTAAIQDEYRKILEVIPADDLAISLDWCMELVEATGALRQILPYLPHDDLADVLASFTSREYIDPHVTGLPDEVLVGFHICGGTFPVYPMATLTDISVPVAAANGIVANAGRRVDFVHLPAVVSSGEAYFAPLAGLSVGETTVYLGLECNDGREAMSGRIDAADKYYHGFGVAHYCGYMWNREILQRLLGDLNAGAEKLATLA